MAASWQSWEGDPGCARLVPCPPVTPVTRGFSEPKLRALVPCICSERKISSPQKAQETACPPIVRALGGCAKGNCEPVPQLEAQPQVSHGHHALATRPHSMPLAGEGPSAAQPDLHTPPPLGDKKFSGDIPLGRGRTRTSLPSSLQARVRPAARCLRWLPASRDLVPSHWRTTSTQLAGLRVSELHPTVHFLPLPGA